MSESNLEEFLTIVTRDLGAASALVLDPSDESKEAVAPSESELTLSTDLPGGRRLVVRFDAAPADADALRRRLSMLASAFGDVLPHEPRSRASRPPPARSLREELAALVKRVGAIEAVIVDAHSPVIWGAAGDAAALDWPGSPEPPPARPSGLHVSEVIPLHGADWGYETHTGPTPPEPAEQPEVEPSAPPDSSPFGRAPVEALAEPEQEDGEASPRPPERSGHVLETAALTMRAMVEVRGLPDLAGLRRGGHLRHMVAETGFGYVARSFAAIYVLVVIFDGPFEELLVKRAIAQALPTIERLVAALPPLNPRPTAGVAALRPRRRR